MANIGPRGGPLSQAVTVAVKRRRSFELGLYGGWENVAEESVHLYGRAGAGCPPSLDPVLPSNSAP